MHEVVGPVAYIHIAVGIDRDVSGPGEQWGEALDALTTDWSDDIQETAVLIQHFQPDEYFTATLYRRMQELLARRTTLRTEERAALEALIDAERDATVARIAEV